MPLPADDPRFNLAALADRAAISDLLSRYVRALDSRQLDEEWSRATFTPDATMDYAPGTVTGRPAILEFNQTLMSWWKHTHHLTTDHVIDLDGDTAQLRANLLVTHVHPDQDRAERNLDADFVFGGIFEGALARTPHGWRFTRLDLSPVWQTGRGPAIHDQHH